MAFTATSILRPSQYDQQYQKNFSIFLINLVKIPKVLNPMKVECVLETKNIINNNVDKCSAKIRRVQVYTSFLNLSHLIIL
jgi:hypothetical protein